MSFFTAVIKCVLFITARKRSFGQGNIFSSVCQEFCSRGGVPEQVPPGQVHPQAGTPPGQVPPGECTPPGRYTPTRYPPGAVHAGRYGQQAGGTHPTEMHSCCH